MKEPNKPVRRYSFLLYFVLPIVILNLCGCATSRALNKEHMKDYSVLEKGTERDLVHAELGIPIIAGQVTNSDIDSFCDVFSFVEGSGGARYLRAFGYSILAVGTLGLSEIITNPAESAIGDDKIRLRVCYDNNLLVEKVEQLKIGEQAKIVQSVDEIK